MRAPIRDEGEDGAKDAGTHGRGRTRDKILQIALDLFSDQGYDKTSLREIAERIGFTKAALYYHFASKGEILMALHMRLHRITEDAMGALDEGPVTVAAWERFLDQAVDGLQANRQLFAMHQRNPSAFEHIHALGHDGQHREIEERARSLIADPALAPNQRIRMAASFGAAFISALLPLEVFADVGEAEFGTTLKQILHDILRPEATRAGAGSAPLQSSEAQWATMTTDDRDAIPPPMGAAG